MDLTLTHEEYKRHRNRAAEFRNAIFDEKEKCGCEQCVQFEAYWVDRSFSDTELSTLRVRDFTSCNDTGFWPSSCNCMIQILNASTRNRAALWSTAGLLPLRLETEAA